MHKIRQLLGFLSRPLRPLLKTGFRLIGNILIQALAKSVLISLWLTAVAAATDAVIYKKKFRSDTTTLISLMKKLVISWKDLNLLKNLVYQ